MSWTVVLTAKSWTGQPVVYGSLLDLVGFLISVQLPESEALVLETSSLVFNKVSMLFQCILEQDKH